MTDNDLAVALNLIHQRLDALEQLIRERHVTSWMRTREAAAFLRCGITKLNQLTNVGLLPFKRQDPTCPKSPRLYHRKHLTAYLVSGQNPIKHRLSPEEKRLVKELI